MQRTLMCLAATVIFGCAGPAETVDDAGLATDAGAACDAPDEGPARAIFVLEPAAEAFFDLPWPNDLRRDADGTLNLTDFPNPGRNSFVSRYVEAIGETLSGFGNNGSVYFRFSRPVDTTSLPTTADSSVASESATFLVDLETGERHPVVWHYQACATRFWPARTLALRPVNGMPLASDRAYAAVVTNRIASSEGDAFGRDTDFERVLSGEAAAAVYGDLGDRLGAVGVDIDTVVAAAIFTTQDAVGETLSVRDWMTAEFPAPELRADELRVTSTSGLRTLVTGTYGPVPIFQAGTLPYTEEGGAITVDEEGIPTVHGTYDARFSLSVPGSPMPEDGYPIVLYAHGTGGDFQTPIRNGVADALARRGLAVMGVDQIHHGARNPTETAPELLFFNIPNPHAGRDNNRQSALDVVQQARLVDDLDLPVETVSRDDLPVRFDASRIFFMGHSQGGLNGPLYLAMDDSARGAVLSAASAVITHALLEKVEPFAIPDVVRALLNLPGGAWPEAFERESFVLEHPVATLLQTWLEASDGSNYGPLIFERPREGHRPTSVLMTEGLRDAYSPPASIEALAGAMFVPPVEPVHAALEAHRLRGLEALTPPVRGNVADGAATAGLLQFPDDGHFAVFNNEVAELQAFGFLESLVDDGIATIPAAP